MDALDIISRSTAKNWLNIDSGDTTWDLDVDRLIRTAVDRAERYTCWQLYERTVTLYNKQQPFYNPADYFPPTGSGEWWGTNYVRYTPEYLSIYLFPFTITSVKDGNGNDVTYTTKLNALKTLLYAAPNSVITLQVGFASGDVAKIPQTFLDACLKMIVDGFENRDNFTAGLPTESNTMLNQYRRAII